ncbi:hypothetical protein LTR51_004917 [Lithohypha guttulata]|nr:hypothetical protein LTR51_004917 [Lithohypha guttulata]
MPDVLKDTIILPAEELEWPRDPHTLTDPYIVQRHEPHHKGISRDLTRRLGDLTQDIFDELSTSIDEEWGKHTGQWTEINPYTTMLKVVFRTGNRIFIGPKLCRNQEFMEETLGFANSVVPNAILIRQLPRFLRPSMIPLITMKNKRHRRRVTEIIMPEVLARQAMIRGDSEQKLNSKPNDFLQWLTEAAELSERDRDRVPKVICGRLKVVNFAAIHTTTITSTNVIFDLISSPSSQDVIDILRREAANAFATNNNTWTKQGINQMSKIDSPLKESFRLGSLSAYGLLRAVVKKGGITTPHSNTYLPEGATVGIAAQAIHHDPEIYPEPNEYRPFPFAELRAEATAKLEGGTAGILKAANLAFPSVSPTFQAFGFGKHACLGRFFAASMLKLLLAYIVQHYEFQMLKRRPDRTWIGPNIICPMDLTVRVKRRRLS